MTISRLDTPLRATWDLHGPAGPLSAPEILTIAGRLVEAGLFYVTLLSRPLAHPAIADLLAVFQDGGIQVQAVFAGSEEEWQGVQRAAAALPGLYIDAGAFLRRGDAGEWEGLGQSIARLQAVGVQPALLMVPDRDRLLLLPRLCAFCRSRGVTRIKLPNTPVDATFPARTAASLPTIDQLAALRAAVGDPVALRFGLTLEVHDLFLWEILFPGERETGRAEYGGCQAANSLAHIDAGGMLHPCSSWPQGLGFLLENDVAALWQQRGRFAVLEKIAELPSGCAGCSDYDCCFGGCRGLVATLGTSVDGRDLLCAGRRSLSRKGCC